MKTPYIEAHKSSSDHKEAILKSDLCGCFYCLAIFPPERIDEWIDERITALCPFCSIDSVIGSASGYPITDEFLRTMRRFWFS